MSNPPLHRSDVKSRNHFWAAGDVTTEQRAARHGHRGAVIWLTGLSGSGKSSIARALERQLFDLGMHTSILDGDNIRQGLASDLGFSPEDRVENIRRVGEVACLMADAGLIVITAFISPYRADRRRARESTLQGGIDFIEVFVSAPLQVCEQRDPKGLYKKARAGEIKEFTGISAPYEVPENPECTVHTEVQTVGESVADVIEHVRTRLKTAVRPDPSR